MKARLLERFASEAWQSARMEWNRGMLWHSTMAEIFFMKWTCNEHPACIGHGELLLCGDSCGSFLLVQGRHVARVCLRGCGAYTTAKVLTPASACRTLHVVRRFVYWTLRTGEVLIVLHFSMPTLRDPEINEQHAPAADRVTAEFAASSEKGTQWVTDTGL